MTSAFGVPQVKKWPFVVGDLVLVGVACWIFVVSNYEPTGWNLAMIIACLGLGIFFSVLPFLAEFREESRRFDANQFQSTLEQIRQLESVGDLVAAATDQWKGVQVDCDGVVKAASEVAARSQAETDRLIELTEKADTRERDHLRLEVEKQRRGEREWLEVSVGIMDHVFALHRAAVRSGQVKLIKQIEGFRAACADICRRVGLSQYVVDSGESFDPELHKAQEGQVIPENAVIEDTMAPGFSFQGHPIRLPMVALKQVGQPGASVDETATELPKNPDLFDQAEVETETPSESEEEPEE
jgi:molecular chaperone GrpE (heat shock protein)